MAIEFKGLPPLSTQDIGNGVQNKNPVKDSGRSQQPISASAPADRVSLTPASTQLRDLEQALSDYPAVDMQRVEAIKQSLEQGIYQIDTKTLALKIIGLEGLLHTKA